MTGIKDILKPMEGEEGREKINETEKFPEDWQIKLPSGVVVMLTEYKVINSKTDRFGISNNPLISSQGEITIDFKWVFSENWGEISGKDRTWEHELGLWKYVREETGFLLVAGETGWDGDKTVIDKNYFRKVDLASSNHTTIRKALDLFKEYYDIGRDC
ncbi:hypothetical protein JW756_03865 [Candidatus Woesearchaeota archaeon]|nr:hypothetical protein [Candidatus Woesearchaeota archaeon]